MELVEMAYCDHSWVPEKDHTGRLVFRVNRSESPEPQIQVICRKCDAEQQLTVDAYYALPKTKR